MKFTARKAISLLLAVIMAFSCAAVALAEGVPATFSFGMMEDESGTAVITGFTTEPTGDALKNFTVAAKDELLDLPFVGVGIAAFAYDETAENAATLEAIETLVIEDGVAEIGEGAFRALPNLKSVVFKGDVIVGEEAFKDCAKLQSVTFNGNTELGKKAFAGCTELETVKLAKDKSFSSAAGALTDTKWLNNYGVDFVMLGTTLVYYAGRDEKVNIPINVEAIAGGAFEGNTYVKEIRVPYTVKYIGDRAFADCTALEKVTIADDCELEYIGEDIFANTAYFNNYKGSFFIVGDTLVKYLGDIEKEINIPNTIAKIAPYAFLGKYESWMNNQENTAVVPKIIVPSSVTELGENCFALEAYDDGTFYAPRIFAFAGSKAAEELEKAGYIFTILYPRGDVDNDGEITVEDARLALRIAVKLDLPTDAQFYAADITANGVVNTDDARKILRIAVKLDEFSIDELAGRSRTKTEILQAYADAVKMARLYKVGYTKVVKNEIVASDVCNTHRDRIVGLASKNMTNSTVTYKNDSQNAVNNLPDVDISDANVKVATSSYNDGKYTYTIRFKNVKDCNLTADNNEYKGGKPAFANMIPVVSGDVFYNAFSSDKSVGSISWWKFKANSDNITANCVRKYALNYTDPVIKIVVDKDTGKVEKITLSVNYHFAVDGRINGIDVSSKGFKSGDGTVDRLDTVTYKNFQW